MPKAITEIRSLARSHTRTALNVLVAVMRNTNDGFDGCESFRCVNAFNHDGVDVTVGAPNI